MKAFGAAATHLECDEDKARFEASLAKAKGLKR